MTPFSQLPLLACSPSGRGAALWAAISSGMKYWMTQSYTGLVQVIQLLWIHNCVSPVCQPITSTKSVSQEYSSTSGVYNLFFFPSSVKFSEPSTSQSHILCTQTVVSLCSNHCPMQKAVLWWRPRAVIIPGYKDKYLEGSFILCPLSGIMLVDFSTRAPCLFMIYIFSNFLSTEMLVVCVTSLSSWWDRFAQSGNLIHLFLLICSFLQARGTPS